MAYEPKKLTTQTDFQEHQLAIVGKHEKFVFQHFPAEAKSFIGIAPEEIASLGWVEWSRESRMPPIYTERADTARPQHSYWKMHKGALYVYGTHATEGFYFKYAPAILWDQFKANRADVAALEKAVAHLMGELAEKVLPSGVEQIMPGVYSLNIDALASGGLEDLLGELLGEPNGKVQ